MAKRENTKTIQLVQYHTFWNMNEMVKRAGIFRRGGGMLKDERITFRTNLLKSYRRTKPRRMIPLEQVFHDYAGETITDETVQRVIAPVIWMIRKGAFDNQAAI